MYEILVTGVTKIGKIMKLREKFLHGSRAFKIKVWKSFTRNDKINYICGLSEKKLLQE